MAQTTEERIAQIAQGFGQGFQNFQGQQERLRAQALQEEALKRQRALQALEVESKISEATGRNAFGSGLGLQLLEGQAFDPNMIQGLGLTRKAELEKSTLQRQAEDRARQIEKDNLVMQKTKQEMAELGKPFEETKKGRRELEKQKYQAIDTLRKEVTGLPATKSLVEIDTALSKIKTAPVSAAGDITRVFSFMKLNDPNSTVREGEYATAQNAAGVPERIRAAYNKSLSGEVLTPQQRKDFETAAENLAKSQYETYRAVISPQMKRMQELGLDSSQILPQFSQQQLFEASTAPQAQQAPQGKSLRSELEQLRALKASRMAGQ